MDARKLEKSPKQQTPNPVKRALALLFAGLFAWSAFLQLNDPDPLFWVLIYGLSSALCLAVVFKQNLPRVLRLFALLAAVGAVWSAYVVWFGEPNVMFPADDLTGWVLVDMEEGREMGGLTIISAVLAGLSFTREPDHKTD